MTKLMIMLAALTLTVVACQKKETAAPVETAPVESAPAASEGTMMDDPHGDHMHDEPATENAEEMTEQQ